MDLDPRQNDPVNYGFELVFAMIEIRIHDISLASKFTFCRDLDLAVWHEEESRSVLVIFLSGVL